MKKKFFSTLLCIALAMSLMACSKDSDSKQKNDKSETQTDQSKQITQAEETQNDDKKSPDFSKAAEKYFVNEEEALKAYGLEKVGMSVVALAWTDNIYLIDAGVSIVALPDNHHIPEDILEKHKSFTDHDGKIDCAKFEELSPEVIIASQKSIDEDASLKKIVENKAIKIVQVPEAKTYDDVLKNIAITSIVFGDQGIAKEKIVGYLERLEEAKALGEGNTKRNTAVIMVTKDGEFLLGTESFANSLLTKLELKNVAADMELSGETDKFGFYPSPGMDKIAEAKPDSLVLMVRMRGEPEEREAACEILIDSIKSAFGDDSDLVKNEKYEIIDHHGIIAVCPITISGLESIASIVFE